MTPIIHWSETNERMIFSSKIFPTHVPAGTKDIFACRTQRPKGHNKEDDSIRWESPHRNYYKLWSFIFIISFYGCIKSSYLNWGLSVINVQNPTMVTLAEHNRKDKTVAKSKIQVLPRYCKQSSKAGRNTSNVNCDALMIKLSLLITASAKPVRELRQ